MATNDPLQQPKTVIIIDGCLADIEEAKEDSLVREVYDSQQLFGGFRVNNTNNDILIKCKSIAENCRNTGKSYDEMLDTIQKEATRIVAERELNKLVRDKNEGLQFVQKANNGKYNILLDVCVRKRDIAKKNLFLNDIYLSSENFEGFLYLSDKKQGKVYEKIAINKRNRRFSLGDILDDIYENQLIRTDNNKKKMKYFSIALCIFFIISVFVCVQTYNDYQDKYAICEQELLDSKYQSALTSYKNECNRITEEATGANTTITDLNDQTEYNSVGDDWYYENWVNDKEINWGGEIYLNFGEKITLESYFAEDDTWPDSGGKKSVVEPSKEELLKGCDFTQSIYVYENNGRYKGNRCTWEVTYSLKSNLQYPDEPKKEEISVTKDEVKEYLKERF